MAMSTMKDWFDEKAGQVYPGVMVAFGIPIESRYSKVVEVSEMLEFARAVAKSGVAHYVTGVFYDSKCGVCTVRLEGSVEVGDLVYESILNDSLETISSTVEMGCFHLTSLDKGV